MCHWEQIRAKSNRGFSSEYQTVREFMPNEYEKMEAGRRWWFWLSVWCCYYSLELALLALYSRKISQGDKLPFSIKFSEDALDKESEEYQTLRNGMKKVLDVIVGLLKDRACAEDDSPSKKKARIEKYRSKK